jgi:type IV pilus biogenesis/stability protein PilW
MSQSTTCRIARVPLAIGIVLAALVGFGARPLSHAPVLGQAREWPADDLFIIDVADTPALAVAQKDALLLSLKQALGAPRSGPALSIDYPFPDSLFPPDMVAPTFLYHDAAAAAKTWLLDVGIAGEPGHIYVLTDGRRPKSEYDPRCGSPEDVYLEPEFQRSAKGWTPAADVWGRLTKLPERSITVAISGLADFPGPASPAGPKFLSSGSVSFKVSEDPIGAPIFYRDVPLLPTKNEKGVVMPLAEGSLPLIEWRLRDLAKPSGVVVLKNMPTCANCHSFSDDGKFLGMDMDGPSGDKGAYALAAVEPSMVIRNEQVFTWNDYNRQWVTFGLFSRISPDGRYVMSSINESIFVTNYLDFRFLQTFYPTRGILAFYDRTTGKIQPLAGAAEPDYVHCNSVWTPDGKSLVFLRAKARDSVPVGPRPEKANDPNEIQIQYDLYTIPFNDGRGGPAKPIPGASANGMSNSFPKVSPDGRWLVWVQAKTGLLMRPDSLLYIMPLAGGKPRRMNCNLSLMNSWHSFSPNGRWMVFSSKANTPYTQMFLTHIDENGNDSPAVLVPGSTAANRAVNIPEFVNLAPDAKMSIDAPAVDYRRHLDRAADLLRTNSLEEAFSELQTADAMKPGFAETLAAMGYYYRQKGNDERAIALFEKALTIDPENWGAHNFYGVTLFHMGKYDEAVQHFQSAIRVNPLNAQSLTNMGALQFSRGNVESAKKYFEEAIDSTPRYGKAHFNLAMVLTREGQFANAAARYEECLKYAADDLDTISNLAWLYATCPDDAVRRGPRALDLARQFERLANGSAGGPRVFDILAAALAEDGQFDKAVEAAATAVRLSRSDDPGLEMRRSLVELYKSGQPYHAGRR